MSTWAWYNIKEAGCALKGSTKPWFDPQEM